MDVQTLDLQDCSLRGSVWSEALMDFRLKLDSDVDSGALRLSRIIYIERQIFQSLSFRNPMGLRSSAASETEKIWFQRWRQKTHQESDGVLLFLTCKQKLKSRKP
ncbi:hypothetical protein FQA47_000296 [Oryzias melastigma]|uniref:Uncharacterized protein n=1 Tax=Oryzias melastigma TaxID=30732 RepID=A0A834F338_ORYME|nr:hypothetical protein FQA47_000296 [Oryzias melastigma]